MGTETSVVMFFELVDGEWEEFGSLSYSGNSIHVPDVKEIVEYRYIDEDTGRAEEWTARVLFRRFDYEQSYMGPRAGWRRFSTAEIYVERVDLESNDLDHEITWRDRMQIAALETELRRARSAFRRYAEDSEDREFSDEEIDSKIDYWSDV